jgi:N utilization substance protein A
MKNEFALAFNEVLEEKGLPKDVVLEAIQAAMVSAYRRSVNASTAQHVEACIDPETGKVHIYAEKEVVDSIQDERTEVLLKEAKGVDPEAEIGNMVIVETTPKDFGRVAAQTARQVIQQRIREAEREAQFNYYSKQVGEIVSGVVQAVNPQVVTLGLELKAEGIMPRNQQIPREYFRVHDRIRALLLEIKTGSRGPQIILSRAHRDFLRRLLENEVPEIYQGLVEIRSISREPGHRSKVAVAALQPGIDPVGACVGIRGVRIQAIVRELHDEKIDVIEWNPDAAAYIAKALSPARVTGVYLDETERGPKTATVVVPEDQLSLAIGRDGQNARLAAKLTSWRIDIKSLPEATSDVLYKLQSNPEYRILAVQETDIIPTIETVLAKKAEGRPVTPEEYHLMGSFVDRVERSSIERRKAIRREYTDRLKAAQEKVPEGAYELPLDALGLSTSVQNLLEAEEYDNAGDLILQMFMDSGKIRSIGGIGPKSMEEIETSIDALIAISEPPLQAPVIEAEPEIAEETGAVAEVAEEAPSEAAEEPTEPTAAVTEVEVEEPTAEEVELLPSEPEVEEAEEELPESLEEIFELKPDMLDIDGFTDDLTSDEEEEEDELISTSKKKGKKAQKKFVEVEYDPEQDVTVYRKRHKKAADEWEDDWKI